MAKRFKFKFCRVIPSFQLCRSKKASNLPETPVSIIHRLSPVNPKALDITYPNLNLPAPDPPPCTPDYSFIKLHLAPKVASVGCGRRAKTWSTEYLSPDVSRDSSADYSWKNESTRLHGVGTTQNSKLSRKTHEGSVSDRCNGDKASVLATNGEKVSVLAANKDKAPVLVTKNRVSKEEKKMEKVKANGSVSSRDGGCFSSELGGENEEIESLISTSRSFSDDSSFELDQSAENSYLESEKNKNKAMNKMKMMKRVRSFGSRKYRGTSKANVSKNITGPPPTAAAVEESVAVLKKSEDPYEDFKRSMLEMILEKQMFETKDLEQLLQCFLSLNSREYHGIIVEAFTEIWEALFCDCPPMKVI